MSSSFSVPSCTSNYHPDDRVPIFRMPDIPPALKQAWIRALLRENLDSLKVVNVCVKHFRSEDVEFFTKYQEEMEHLLRYLAANLS